MKLALGTVLAEVGLYEHPEPWTYVTFGYSFCILGIAAYALSLMARGRRLARQVPPGERRWMAQGTAESDT